MLKNRKRTHKLWLSIMVLDGFCSFLKRSVWSCSSFSALTITCAPSLLPPLLNPECQSLPPAVLTVGHSFSIAQLGGTGCFVFAALRMPHLLLELRRFARQTTPKVVLCVTQRRQCVWQLWNICVQATLASNGPCEIRRNGVKVRGRQAVFVCTVYPGFGWTGRVFDRNCPMRLPPCMLDSS